MEESATPTVYAVICRVHGRVYLTEAEYLRQLRRPDSRWECPRFVDDVPSEFGPCGRPSNFDDETYEAGLGL
jgi:hypothetical protein